MYQTHRPPTPVVEPVFTTCHGSALSIWRTGTSPNRRPLSSARNKATALKVSASGCTGRLIGIVNSGCQALSPRNRATLPAMPNVPPRSATRWLPSKVGAERGGVSTPARGAKQFHGAVGRARRKQAAQVGAGGQQNQPCQEHQAGHKRPDRAAQQVLPRRPGRAKEKVSPSSSFG